MVEATFSDHGFLLLAVVCALVGAPLARGKVFLVLMDEDPVITYRENKMTQDQETCVFYISPLVRNFKNRRGTCINEEDLRIYKHKVATGHDSLLQSLFPLGSYTKLYSYTHLLNGFAVHTSNNNETIKTLLAARGVRHVHEDVRLQKLTTHSPDFLGIPQGAWPQLGGALEAGSSVVIGMLDSGINPGHPSFANPGGGNFSNGRFKGSCESGDGFPPAACNGKIVGARHFARGATATGEFNASRDYASPFDADGHGSHTASTAAGNYQVPVVMDGFAYGNASGMAPGARIAVYKALFSFGGFMSDVVAAVDQAVEDGVDVLSLSIGPQNVPQGSAAFLNTLDMELLFATRAGVLVVQAVGNGGPSPGTTLSFSPWIMSVAASTTDRKYSNTIKLGNGRILSGAGLTPPTDGDMLYPISSAGDVALRNATFLSVENCQNPDVFSRSLARGKIILCTYTFDLAFDIASINNIAGTISTIGAVGFIIAVDPDLGSDHFKGTRITFPIPGIVLDALDASDALWTYYNANTFRKTNGIPVFRARARINDGRRATYTGQGPVVASYSSRGPDVNNVEMQTADVLKPNILAPGSLIWAAWSPTSQGDQYTKAKNFALLSGTSMATPHAAGVAALVKNKHPAWSPAAVASAMMTTANVTDRSGVPIQAQGADNIAAATPFDYGSGMVNAERALDPGLVFDIEFRQYVQFLCAVPGVDEESVRRAVGAGCPASKMQWCSELNTPSVTVANLLGSRKVRRRVTNVGTEKETYQVVVRQPVGVTVTVSPVTFNISPNATRSVRILLQATEATNAYSFGQLLFLGDKNHEVRVPIAVYVTSTLEQKNS